MLIEMVQSQIGFLVDFYILLSLAFPGDTISTPFGGGSLFFAFFVFMLEIELFKDLNVHLKRSS